MKHLYFLMILIFLVPLSAFEKVNYVFEHRSIDVVIPCHPKDAASLNRAIESVKKCVRGLRRVMVISSEKITDEAEWIDEKIFPFTKQSIALEIFKTEEAAHEYLSQPKSRIGWIYQQILKLYAYKCISDISPNILVVDADVVFLKPVMFMQVNHAGVYDVGDEYHAPYFGHAARVLPELTRLYKNRSGIVHHMLFQKPVLDDLFDLIQKQHGLEPWVAIARAIQVDDRGDIDGSAMSEYEMYFNFVFARTEQVRIRRLKRADTNFGEGYPVSKFVAEGYDYVTIHKWD